MWLYMCYSEEAHIRVATLSNHLLQNNDFTKLIFEETYMPPWQRLTPLQRFGRFLFIMGIFLCVAANVCTYGLSYHEEAIARRRLCLAACEEAHFPDLTCVQPSDVSTIEYGGNTYTDLYTFKEPSLPSYQNETTTMAWDMFQTCREYAANITNHYDYQNTGRQAKLHTCFPSCKRNVETENPDVYDYGSGDTRPVCTTEDQSRRLVNSDFSDLICVDPDDAVDPWAGPFEICAGSGFCFSWAYVLLIIAVANTFQVVIEFLMLYVMTLVDDAKEDCLEATVKTILQFILMFTFCLVVVFAVGPFILQSRVGRPYIIPATWFLALVTDQLKNFAVQCLIWWLVIRRCGRVDPGIQEYNEEYLMQWELQDSLAGHMQMSLAEWLERPVIATSIIAGVGLYSAVMLIDLAFSSAWENNQLVVDIFYYIDLGFLVFFLAEIILKTFAYGVAYLLDPWNFVDTAVVMVSFVFALLTQGATRGLALLRILRLVRVIMVVRKVKEGRKKLKSMKKSSSGVDVFSTLEKVIDILADLQDNKNIPAYLQEEIEWASDIIVSQKLYDVSIEEEEGKTDASLDLWLSASAASYDTALMRLDDVTGRSAGGTRTGAGGKSFIGSKAGQSFLGSRVGSTAGSKGGTTTFSSTSAGTKATGVGTSVGGKRRRRGSNASRRMTQQDVEREASKLTLQLYSVCRISGDEESQIEDAMRLLDSWQFDVHLAKEVCDRNLIAIVFVKTLTRYGVIRRFNMSFEGLYRFCSIIQESFPPEVPFHCPSRACDLIQTAHFFIQKGSLQKVFLEIDVFIVLFAALVKEFGHPGVQNAFLVRTRHRRAIRYNDVSVLENYTLATIWTLLQQDEMQFFGDIKEAYQSFRTVIIELLLRQDLTKFQNEMGFFRTKITSSEFPSIDSTEDRRSLYALCIQAASHAFPARPFATSAKWTEAFMEELWMQGDLEKQLGLSVSPFCDRELTSVSKCTLGYIDVVVEPLLGAFIVVLGDENKKAIEKEVMEDGLDSNKKSLQLKADSNQ